MSIARRLADAMGLDRRINEWVLCERARDGFTVDDGDERGESGETVTAAVHRDLAGGRGSARLVVEGEHAAIDDRVAGAIARAERAVGPSWSMARPAAPARVELLDPALRGAPKAAIRALAAHLDDLVAASGLRAFARSIELVREATRVTSSQGLEVEWDAALLTATAELVTGSASTTITLAGRRLGELERALEAAIQDAERRLDQLGHAVATPRGATPLLLHAEALLGGTGLGVLEVFAAQAEAVRERQGRTRYRPGAVVAVGAAALAEPLTITSDGAMAFGLRSAPLADEGEPVRRFALVDRGIAGQLALDQREAALRRRLPNGGVRNLVVHTGGASDAELRAPPVLEILELSWLDVDVDTGHARAAIRLAVRHDKDGQQVVAGGIARFDAITALALARRNQTIVNRAAYRGPSLWRLPAVEIL